MLNTYLNALNFVGCRLTGSLAYVPVVILTVTAKMLYLLVRLSALLLFLAQKSLKMPARGPVSWFSGERGLQPSLTMQVQFLEPI